MNKEICRPILCCRDLYVHTARLVRNEKNICLSRTAAGNIFTSHGIKSTKEQLSLYERHCIGDIMMLSALLSPLARYTAIFGNTVLDANSASMAPPILGPRDQCSPACGSSPHHLSSAPYCCVLRTEVLLTRRGRVTTINESRPRTVTSSIITNEQAKVCHVHICSYHDTYGVSSRYRLLKSLL